MGRHHRASEAGRLSRTAVGGVTGRGCGNELRVRKVARREPAMKLWKLVLVVTIVGVVVLLLAGRNDIARIQSMRRM
jgi:hypothetical protein